MTDRLPLGDHPPANEHQPHNHEYSSRVNELLHSKGLEAFAVQPGTPLSLLLTDQEVPFDVRTKAGRFKTLATLHIVDSQGVQKALAARSGAEAIKAAPLSYALFKDAKGVPWAQPFGADELARAKRWLLPTYAA